MNKSPAYQWYPKDILASSRVGEMTAEEECWYRRALDFCWVNGTIPTDLERLARLIGKGATANGLRVVIKMFVPCSTDDTRLVHERQEIERQKQHEWREKSAKGGKAGKGKRKERQKIDSKKGGVDLVATKTQPNEQQNDTLQSAVSSLPSPSSPPPPNGNAATAAVDDPVQRRIWKDGLDLLKTSALTESKARPLLGRLAKDYGSTMLAEAIAVTQAANPADPQAFLIGVLRKRSGATDRVKSQLGKDNGKTVAVHCDRCQDVGEIRVDDPDAQFGIRWERCDCKFSEAA